MKKKYVLPLIFFLGNLTSQTLAADTSTTSAQATQNNDNNASPMQTLATTTPQSTQMQKMPKMPTQIPSTTTTEQQPAQQPTTPQSAMPAVPATDNSASSTTAAIDCSYAVPDGTSPENLSTDTIIQWANYAAIETFTYDFRNYDKQFKQLKTCYTTTGWESFLNAMKASNNLKVTQEEHLFVTAKINGKSQLIFSPPSGNNQPTWMVRIPLLVTYQNQDREVTQDMYIDLSIKTNYGVPIHLGINQIIASPKTGS